MGLEEEVQEAAEKGRTVVGTEETLKEAEAGELDKIVLASNTPEKVRERVDGVEADVQESGMDNSELGSACMKPFSATVVGLKG